LAVDLAESGGHEQWGTDGSTSWHFDHFVGLASRSEQFQHLNQCTVERRVDIFVAR
jgi:hypothetical protein